MDVLKSKAMLKALKWILIKYGKIEDIQAQQSVFIPSCVSVCHTFKRDAT
jgi:hypothetical protein